MRVISAVWGNFHPDAEPAEQLVLILLADRAHDDGVTWVKQDDIARDLLLSKRHVIRCLQALEERGEIQVRQEKKGRGRRNIYRVMVAPFAPSYEDLPITLREPFDLTAESWGDTVSPGDSWGDRSDRSGVTMRSPEKNVSRSVSERATGVALSGKPRKRNLVFDALAEACGIREQLLDKDSPIYDKDLAKLIGVAQSSIRKKAQGLDDAALAEEVRLRALCYRERWPDIDITPPALAKNWNVVVQPRGESSKPGRYGRGLTTQQILDRYKEEADGETE